MVSKRILKRLLFIFIKTWKLPFPDWATGVIQSFSSAVLISIVSELSSAASTLVISLMRYRESNDFLKNL